MKKKLIFLILLGSIALAFSGCATNVGPQWENRWFVNQIEPGRHDYVILGHVQVERDWFGVLGVRMPPFFSFYLFETGGVTHADVLNEARRMFPDTNAVININVSSRENIYGPFFASRTFTVTGLAVKYATEQLNARVHSAR